MPIRLTKGPRDLGGALICLAALLLDCAAALPAAAQQPQGFAGIAAGLVAASKPPPTILATPPFFQEIGQFVRCAAINIGTTPLAVTFTFRTQNQFPPIVQTITLQPNASAAVGEGAGMPALPLRAFCEFQSTDVTSLRASGTVLDGSGTVLQIIPAS